MSLRHLTFIAASGCALILLGGGASAASLSRSVDVNGTPATVWSVIGPFCAIQQWHPAISTCTEGGAAKHTRTLLTRDGNATFVETQTGRNDTEHSYSYVFDRSPLPVTHYTSTLKVTSKGKDISTVTWTGTYVPDPGKEIAANQALLGIYEAGLNAIQAKLVR
jgi:hypothetical protein